jgi:glycosyltransferase involved in cell wall biosynthesis
MKSNNNKLNICFVMFACYPLFNKNIKETFGGSEVELYNLAVHLSKRDDVNIDFIVGDYGQTDVEMHGGIRLRKSRYMNLDKYRSFKHKILRYFYFLKILFFQDSQIFITKTASEVLGCMVLLLRFLRGKKVVFRLGSDKDVSADYWKSYGKRFYYLYRFGLKNCSLVYTQSINQSGMLKESENVSGYVVKNVYCLRTGGHSMDKGYILWVSRCEPLKRPLMCIELARMLPKERFVMIMPHARKADDKLDREIDVIMSQARRACVKLPNFTHIEYVQYDEIQYFYNEAKLFVNTSEYEGFPNSFIQACMGKSGIISLRVNPDKFITRYRLGFCCDDSIEKAAEIIGSLGSEQIHMLGENAYDYVVNNHDVSKLSVKYMEDFRTLVSDKKFSASSSASCRNLQGGRG